MCGLVGLAGPEINNRHLETFKDLLFISALRGVDGTGVSQILTPKTGEKIKTFKLNDSPQRFLDVYGGGKGFLSSKDNSNGAIMLGHCRWPTIGDTSIKNVHPFDVGRFLGAHNGTLESEKFHQKGKTDSQILFETMVQKGIKSTLESLYWWDAYAISVYEKGTGKIYLGRNHARPLAVGVCKKTDTLFWASEYMFIYTAAIRNGLDVEVFNLRPNTLYEIYFDDIAAGVNEPWTSTKLGQGTPTDDVTPARYKSFLGQKLDDPLPF